MAVDTLLAKACQRRTHVEETLTGGLKTMIAVRAIHQIQVPCPVPVSGIDREIYVKIASTRAEWHQALQLVADNYQARGYAPPGDDFRFTSYHALPETVVLVAKAEGRVVATFTLVPDNTLLGLPLEGLYQPEVQELRRTSRHMFETTCLADCSLSTREFVQVFLTLIRLAWHYGVSEGGETNVIT